MSGNKMALDALTAIVEADDAQCLGQSHIEQARAAIAALQAEPQPETEQNAARYVWLRDRIDPREVAERLIYRGHNVNEQISLRTDAEVDAAITKSQPVLQASPHLCIAPACGPKCSDCNSAISDVTMRRYAIRYAYLRDHDPRFGMPTAWLAFPTLDEAIDAALPATPPKD